jgi:hypothetical protein
MYPSDLVGYLDMAYIVDEVEVLLQFSGSYNAPSLISKTNSEACGHNMDLLKKDTCHATAKTLMLVAKIYKAVPTFSEQNVVVENLTISLYDEFENAW